MQFKETYNHLRVERNYTCTSDGNTTFPVVVVVVDDEFVVVVVVRATGIDAGSMPRSRSVACAWSCADEGPWYNCLTWASEAAFLGQLGAQKR